MSFIKRIILPVFSISILVLLFLNRQVPSGDLWKGYTLVYVPVNSDEIVIQEAFKKSSIENVVSLSEQEKYLPVAIESKTPEQSLIFLSAFKKSSNDYLTRRRNYFFDQSKNFKVYYVPSQYKNNLKNCLNYLLKNHIEAGIDSKAVYPIFLPVICMVLFGVFFYFAKNKLLFSLISVFPIFYIFTNPFYPSGIAVTFVLLLIFCCTNLWKREGAVKILEKNYYLGLFGITAILLSFSSSILSGLYFLLTVFASIAFLIFYDELENLINHKRAFNFLYIRPAKMVSLFSGKTNFIMLSLISIQVLIIVVFFLTSNQTVSNKFAKVLLPSSNVLGFEKDESLPELDEYYRWNWKIYSYPYLSLNKSYDENLTEIIYPEYEEIDGRIQKVEYRLSYDEKFIDQINKNIDLLGFESIEKVLKSQNGSLTPGFSSVKSNPVNIFGIIMMIVSLLLLLFIYFSVIIKLIKFGGKK